MRLLAVDTALGACQAAVLDGDRVTALSEVMARGHQERLAPLAAEAMARAGLAFAALDRVAVTVGPGSFTGLRVGLAFAKGLGLALDVPVLGIGTLGALAWTPAPAGIVAAVVDAGRGRVHLQVWSDGAATGEPETLELAAAGARLAQAAPARLVGPGAPLVAQWTPHARIEALVAPDPVALARLAARLAPDAAPPSPLYLRAPDARTLAERRADAAAA